MSRKRASIPAILTLVLCMILGAAACQSQPGNAGAPSASATTQGVESGGITVVGQNYCLGCALKKEQGAAAQCSTYGHRHALRVESAKTADGEELPALVGESLHYLDNDRSASLVKGEELHGKRVEVKGKLFAPERTLEVVEVKAL